MGKIMFSSILVIQLNRILYLQCIYIFTNPLQSYRMDFVFFFTVLTLLISVLTFYGPRIDVFHSLPVLPGFLGPSRCIF